MSGSDPVLTIITPAFNESANLPTLSDRLTMVMAREGIEWEWIVVDDHSGDATPDVVEALAARSHRVRGVRFARNHGSHAAILFGLREAAGDAAVVLAADLQDPPEIIPELIDRWKQGAQVVWAVRRARLGERADTVGFARLYYFIMRRLVGLTQMPATGADFFLVDRAVIDAVRQFAERHVSVFALLAWMGFRQDSVEYDKQPRVAGRSGWSLTKKLNLLSDSVTAFSDFPLRLGSAAGIGLMLLGALCAVAAIAGVELGPLSAGWVLLFAGILLVGGLNLLMLGIVGEYVWRALDESRRRPAHLVERRFGATAAAARAQLSTGAER